MKIVFLSDDFPPVSFGGAGISTYELAIGMKNAGHDVSVITTCRDTKDAGRIEYHGLTIYKVASTYSYRWRFVVSIYNRQVVTHVKSILKEINPDVVHANNIHFYISYHALKVAKEYAKVVVWTARDTMAVCFGKLGTKRYLANFDYRTTWVDHVKQAKKRWNPFYNFFVRKYLGYADKLFAVSDSLRKAFEENGIPNVQTLHTGGNTDAWDVVESELDAFKEKHKLQNKKIILFGGRLSEAKGGKKTIEAMALMVAKNKDYVLLVAGSVDAYAKEMKTEAAKLGIEHTLVFTGWIEREKIKYAYSAADVVLVPSLYLDPFPRIVIEGMSAGKPVVATCYGGASEIVENGVTGYVVNPLHPEEIAEKTLELLDDQKKAKEFGEQGKQRIDTLFKLEDKIEEYVVEYKALLQR